MITKEMFITAYHDGFVKIEFDPDDHSATCQIGNGTIFLGFLDSPENIPFSEPCEGKASENTTLNTLYELVQEIGDSENYAPNGIYSRCERFLRRRYPDMAKAQDERMLTLQAASDDELVQELFHRDARLSFSSVRRILKNAGYIAWKLWTREDIGDVLMNTGYTDSEANIDLVLNTGYLNSLEESNEQDWEIISSAIHSCASKLEPRRFKAIMEHSPDNGNKTRKNLIDARTERFETMELFGKTVLFTDMRIDPDTVPDGLYLYGLRHGDDGNEPSTLEYWLVGVNHFGDVLSDKPFDLPVWNDPYLKIGDEDWRYLPDMITVREYFSIDKSKEGK